MANRNIKGITIEIDGNVTPLEKSLKDVNRSLKDTQSALKDVDKLLKLDPKNTELLQQKQKLLATAIEGTKEKLEKERQALAQLKEADQTPEVVRQMEILERQIVDDEQALKSLEAQSKSLAPSMKQSFADSAASMKEVSDKVKEVGDNMKQFGTELTTHVTAPIVAAAGAALAAFKEVDEAYDTMIAKTGATGEKAEELQEIINSIAVSMPASFAEIGSAVGEVNTRFGVTGEELEDLSKRFIMFAQLNGVDVSTSIDQVQKAMTAFGLTAEDADSVLDRLNKVGQDTGVSMGQLTSGLVQNSAVFQQLGLDLDQAATFMGQLEVSGVDSSTALSGLSKALKNATEDGTPLNEALANLQNTIANGKEGTSGLADAYDLFGKSAGSLFQAVKNGSVDFTTLGESAETASGNLQTTFEATQDPIDQVTTTMNDLKITMADFGATIQTSLVPVLQQLTGYIDQVKQKWEELSPEQQEQIVQLLGVAAAVGPVLVVLGSLVGAIGALISPIGGFIAALGLTVFQVKSTIDLWKREFLKVYNFVKEPLDKAVAAVREAWNTLKGILSGELPFPRIKLPHFSLSGEFSLVPPSVPRISVDWYAKGGIFTSPSIIGVGEAGNEAVIPLNTLWTKLDRIADASGAPTVINVYGAAGQSVDALAAAVERKLIQSEKRRVQAWR